MKNSLRKYILPILLALEVFSAGSGWSADHRNLEEGFPTRIEDAYPIAYRALEFQAGLSYEREGSNGSDDIELEPELKWGFMKNAHVALATPLIFRDDGDHTNNGDIEIEGFYNLNVESQSLPAFAIKSSLQFPTGVDSQGTDFDLVGILTKGWGENRIHLNGGYTRNAGRDSGERADLYTFGLGYDRPIDLDHLFVAELFVDRSPVKGRDPLFSYILGIRKQLNPWSVLAFGLGSGFGSPEAVDFKATVAYQLGFLTNATFLLLIYRFKLFPI